MVSQSELLRSFGVAKPATILESDLCCSNSKNMFYVYSLRCKDGFYVGCTEGIQDRIERHQKGQVPATADRLPLKLEFYLAVENKYVAYNLEKYLKSGSGRAFVKRHFV